MISGFITQLRTPNTVLNQMMRFGLVTGMSASVTVGLPVVLHEFGNISPRIAVAISFVAGFAFTFLATRRLVFNSKSKPWRDLLVFAGSTALFRSAEYLTFLLLMDSLGLYYVLALLISLVFSMVLKFFWYRYVFAGRASAV